MAIRSQVPDTAQADASQALRRAYYSSRVRPASFALRLPTKRAPEPAGPASLTTNRLAPPEYRARSARRPWRAGTASHQPPEP